MNLSDLRAEYTQQQLKQSNLSQNPIEQLEKWLNDAKALPLANAALLSTANNTGRVSSRTVLLQTIKNNKLYFYTHYQSAKAIDIAQNNQVCLSFFWHKLERQTHIIGIVEKTSRQQSEQYFATRPKESQIAAWSSKQSKTIKNRAELEEQYQFYEQKFKNKPVPCPKFWGGYQLVVNELEFWQGGKWRLHDRFSYQNHKNKWEITRLAP